MEDASNESGAAAYDVHRLGLGMYGVLRFGREADVARGAAARSAPATDEPPPVTRQAPGAFLLAGVAAELEWTRLIQCGYACLDTSAGDPPVMPGPSVLASKVGLRMGAGYSFSLVEFRVGALGVVPSAGSAFPDPIWSPDVLLRIGPRNVGWGELGFGAYDGSTALRPGAYVGGGGGRVDLVRVTGHLGIHLVNGLCCQTTLPFGLIAQLGVDRAISRSLIAGVDFKWEAALREVFAGGAHLTFLL